MAREGHAPRILLRTNGMGSKQKLQQRLHFTQTQSNGARGKLTWTPVPYIAVLSISLFICLGYMTLSHSSSTVFGWLQDLVSVSALVGWMVICIVYLRFYYVSLYCQF